MTLCIGQLQPITVYRTGFWVCPVLVLSVIVCSFYLFLDRGLFHCNSCNYYWIFFYVLSIYWPTHLCFVKLGRSGSATITSLTVSAPGHCLWMLDWACYTFALLCVMFRFFTRIFYRGVPGFATDCPCSVWCHGLNHLPSVWWSTFWKPSLKW